jgi:hypothetical protein
MMLFIGLEQHIYESSGRDVEQVLMAEPLTLEVDDYIETENIDTILDCLWESYFNKQHEAYHRLLAMLDNPKNSDFYLKNIAVAGVEYQSNDEIYRPVFESLSAVIKVY